MGGALVAPSSSSTSSTSLKDVKGAATSLSDFSCKATGKAWSATATLANKTKATLTYQVRVAVVKPKSFQGLGTKQGDFPLNPGKAVEVRFDHIDIGSEAGLLCVPSVVTGSR